jgi:hypothetical protein
MDYVRHVRRLLNRLAKPVALLVIAAQLLLGFSPLASARAPAAAGTHAPCDETAVASHNDGCPCCPDDASSMKDCLVMCTLAAAVTPSEFVVAVTPSHGVAFVEFADYVTTLSDPPLKPPPIA